MPCIYLGYVQIGLLGTVSNASTKVCKLFKEHPGTFSIFQKGKMIDVLPLPQSMCLFYYLSCQIHAGGKETTCMPRINLQTYFTLFTLPVANLYFLFRSGARYRQYHRLVEQVGHFSKK